MIEIFKNIKNTKLNLLTGLVVPILVIIFGVYFVQSTLPQPQNLTIKGGDVNLKIDKPLYSFLTNDSNTYNLKFDLNKKSFVAQNNLKLFLTGCPEFVEINGQQLNAEEVFSPVYTYTEKVLNQDQERYSCKREKPFILKLDKYTGENIKVDILMKHNPGEIGISWHSYEYDIVYLLLSLVTNLGIFLIVWFVCQQLGLGWVSALIIFGGVLMREHFMGYTAFWDRNYDLADYRNSGHLGFIEYISKNWTLPDPSRGWQYHQAPLYYLLAGALFSVVTSLGVYFVYPAIQLLNLVIFVGYLVVAILISKKFLRPSLNRKAFFAFHLLSLILVTIPSGVIHSVRISNDILFYLLSALTIYFLANWVSKSKTRDLYLSSTMIAVGLMTKVNSLILVVLLVITVLIKYVLKNSLSFNWDYFQKIRSDIISVLKPLLLIIIIISVGFGVGFFKKIEAKIADPSKDWLVTSEDGLSKDLFVKNTVGNIVLPDLVALTTVPEANPFKDEGGRQSFVTYLLKTSVAAEFQYDESKDWYLTGLFTIAFVLLVYFGFIIATSKKEWFLKNWFLLLCLGVFLAGSIYYRVKTPCACNQDFRFVYPLQVPYLIILFILGQKINAKKYPVLYYSFWILLIIFVLLSVLFIL